MKMTQYLKWKADPSKGEVFTPISLVSEMLDKIPNEVWINPNTTFLDPCMGKGTFLLEIVRRLVYIYGYTEDDAKSRVYGYDIRVKCVGHLIRRGLKNVRHKDFLNENILMKFDVIIGNPPYQDSNKTKGKNSSLWTKFILLSEKLLNSGGYLSFITPISWFAPSESQKNELKKVFNDNQLLVVNTECKKYFTVGSTFAYFLIKKTEKNDNGTLINDKFYHSIQLPFLPKVLTETSLSITKKIFFTNQPKLKFSSSLRNDELSNEGEYQVWYGNNFKRSSKLGGNYNLNKVIVNKPGYLNPRYDEGQFNTSANNYWVEVNSEAEATNIINFMKSEIGGILIENLFKYSGFNSLGILKMLPLSIKNNSWQNDKDFQDVFGLSEFEIQYIKNGFV